jgi:hypothetical protein
VVRCLRASGNPGPIVDPEAAIDLADLADAIHAALLTESTAGQIPLAIHLACQEKWIEAAQIISGPPSGGPTLLMADEIFCSEAWAVFDPSEVARRGAGSYALTKQLADAEERAVMCRYLPQGVVPSDNADPCRNREARAVDRWWGRSTGSTCQTDGRAVAATKQSHRRDARNTLASRDHPAHSGI